MRMLLQILFHPVVRSFQVRAALGQSNWNRLHSDLPFIPLDQTAPNVVATYLLNGRRCANSSSKDEGYVGSASQAGGTDGRYGAAQRLAIHRRRIRNRVTSNQSSNSDIHAYKSFADSSVEAIFYCLLTVLPTPALNPILSSRPLFGISVISLRQLTSYSSARLPPWTTCLLTRRRQIILMYSVDGIFVAIRSFSVLPSGLPACPHPSSSLTIVHFPSVNL